MKTSELRSLVRKHHAGLGWAVFDEVRSETGYTVGQAIRTCDMLAMSLWRSRGMELHGFELKVSRGDWLRELRQPDKAVAIAKYVDRWWLVTPSLDVALPGELPAGWGLMVFDPGSQLVLPGLRVAQKAPKREALSLDRPFIAAIMRKLARGQFTADSSATWEPNEVR